MLPLLIGAIRGVALAGRAIAVAGRVAGRGIAIAARAASKGIKAVTKAARSAAKRISKTAKELGKKVKAVSKKAADKIKGFRKKLKGKKSKRKMLGAASGDDDETDNKQKETDKKVTDIAELIKNSPIM